MGRSSLWYLGLDGRGLEQHPGGNQGTTSTPGPLSGELGPGYLLFSEIVGVGLGAGGVGRERDTS